MQRDKWDMLTDFDSFPAVTFTRRQTSLVSKNTV